MNIQIWGRKKCFDTQKALRYFKERRISVQYIDLQQKAPSKGELQSIMGSAGLDALIARDSPLYERLNLNRIAGQQMRAEVLFNNPPLYTAPIVRNGRQATVGYKPEVWKDWE